MYERYLLEVDCASLSQSMNVYINSSKWTLYSGGTDQLMNVPGLDVNSLIDQVIVT